MTDLADGEFELGGLVFGGFGPYGVHRFNSGRRSYRTQDQPVPRAGGRLFGRDEPEARTLAWTIHCEAPGDPAGVRALERDLAAAWTDEGTYRRPGATRPLRMRGVGSTETRRVLGRPRRYSADDSGAVFGLIGVTADFATVDGLFYADNPVAVALDIVTAQDTGLAGPWQGPLADAGTAASRPGILDVPGQVPTRYIEVVFEGPVTYPAVEIVGVGTVTVQVELLAGQRVELAVHPSMRRADRIPGGSVAGKIRGTDLVDMALPPGWQEVRYHGTDLTATSKMTFTAWPAYISL